MNTSIWRGLLGALLGYVIFAAPVAVMFKLMGWDPHAPASLTVMVASTVVGIIAAAVGGFVATRIARARWAGAAVAALIVIGALISIASTRAGGAVWSQVVALVLLAPAALIASGRSMSPNG